MTNNTQNKASYKTETCEVAESAAGMSSGKSVYQMTIAHTSLS